MTGKVFLFDSGHGGMLNNISQTDPKAGKYFGFPSGEVAYEGVINRQIKGEVLELFNKNGLSAVDVCPTELDLTLDTRCDIVNSLCDQYGNDRCVFVSLHSNAGGGRGFEIWTSPGQTKSDKYADYFVNSFAVRFPEVKIRKDISDGDADKESKFYVLVNTKCPAILPEFLFFDNYEDYQLLKRPDIRTRYVNAILDFGKFINHL